MPLKTGKGWATLTSFMTSNGSVGVLFEWEVEDAIVANLPT